MALGTHKQEQPTYRWDALLTGQHSVTADGAEIGVESGGGVPAKTEAENAKPASRGRKTVS
jgi:hypothetical protein